MKKVAVIMGSDSDLPVVADAIKRLKEFEIPFEVKVLSAHRTPAQAEQFASAAAENGFGVIIAAAGKAAHLGGVIAAYTTLPVIGLPIKSSTLDGLDSLLSIVQMPSGSLSLPSPSTARPTQRFWPPRSWHSRRTLWRKSWRRTREKWRKMS
jgi:5-(carboxyamino)imidazole ribonucleotide mutase